MLDSCTNLRADAPASSQPATPSRTAGQLRRSARIAGREAAAKVWARCIDSCSALRKVADKKDLWEMRTAQRGIQVGDLYALGKQGASFLRAVADDIESNQPTPADPPLSQVGRAMAELGDVARVVTEAMANPASPGRFDEAEAKRALREIREARAVLDGLERTVLEASKSGSSKSEASK